MFENTRVHFALFCSPDLTHRRCSATRNPRLSIGSLKVGPRGAAATPVPGERDEEQPRQSMLGKLLITEQVINNLKCAAELAPVSSLAAQICTNTTLLVTGLRAGATPQLRRILFKVGFDRKGSHSLTCAHQYQNDLMGRHIAQHILIRLLCESSRAFDLFNLAEK